MAGLERWKRCAFTDSRPAGKTAAAVLARPWASETETLASLGAGQPEPIEMDERRDPNVDHVVDVEPSAEVDEVPVERLEDRSPSLHLDL